MIKFTFESTQTLAFANLESLKKAGFDGATSVVPASPFIIHCSLSLMHIIFCCTFTIEGLRTRVG